MRRLTTTGIGRGVWCLAVALVSVARGAAAQQLAPKPAIASSGPSGCAAFEATLSTPAPGTAAADDAEARQLIADGQDAALQGEHAAARDAFAKAAVRAPTNARLAYYLGREHEALNESTPAVQQYCRYLALSPNAADADEVRGRIVRLVPASALARVEEARANFRSGVALLERRQYSAADSVFGAIARQLPTAAEAFFNRGLTHAARGQRAPALEDFERYLELTPAAPDRASLRAVMTQLPDRVYMPTPAFVSGIVPGLGQMNTGRPILGVAVLGAVAGAIAFGLRQQQSIVVRQFTDPFGNPYLDSLPRTERPDFVVAAAAAGVLWLGSAYEAYSFARRSRARAESIVRTGPPAPARQNDGRDDGVDRSHTAALTPQVTPFVGASSRAGLLLGFSVSAAGRSAQR